MTDELNYHLSQTILGRQSRRAFLGKALALGLTTLAAQTLYTTAAEAQGARKGGHLIFGLRGGDPTNRIHAAKAVAPVPKFNLRLLGDTLVETQPGGRLEMRLAEEVTASADGLVWRLRIRKDVAFHDGRRLGPEDVLATLEWHRNPENASPALRHLMGIESILIEGDQIAIYLHAPDFYFAQGLGDVSLSITAGGVQGKGAVYTGGYRMIYDEPGVRHHFERFENYWDDSRAHLDQVEALVINDPVLRAASIAGGQIHVAAQINPSHATELGGNSALKVTRMRGAEVQGFGMQVTAKLYDNADLRLALKYAVDRQGILDAVLDGHGTLGNDLPATAGVVPVDHMIEQRRFDPDLAAFHYRRARGDGAPIILRVSEMAFPKAQEAAAIFAASARAAKIPVEIRREEDDLYWSEVWDRQPFAAAAECAAPSMAMALSCYRRSAPGNVTRFGDEPFEKGVAALRAEPNPMLRREAELTLAQRLHEEGGLIAPVRADVYDVHRADVMGYRPMATGSMMDGYAGTKLWLA